MNCTDVMHITSLYIVLRYTDNAYLYLYRAHMALSSRIGLFCFDQRWI
jgi:hypothetical protein